MVAARRRSPSLLPLLANTFGWIFTEMGRQPWAVFGVMRTADGVSPSVGAATVATSLIVFTLLYAALAVVEVGLLVRYAKAGPAAGAAPATTSRPRPTRHRRAGRPARVRVLSRPTTGEADTMALTDVWFILIAVLWAGYFVLDGFDLGVGMLLPVLAKDDAERRLMVNTIGPVWDGNEVWLLVAGGATFAAFPVWYATMFSGFYLALLLLLVALIIRGVSFEYRGKINDAGLAAALGRRHRRRLGPAGPAARRRPDQRRARRTDRQAAASSPARC